MMYKIKAKGKDYAFWSEGPYSTPEDEDTFYNTLEELFVDSDVDEIKVKIKK